MYSKKCGHTDWVTAVAHLKDNRVISAGMDGKLCLWNANDRSRCVDLVGGHTKSISKVIIINIFLYLYFFGWSVWKRIEHRFCDTLSL